MNHETHSAKSHGEGGHASIHHYRRLAWMALLSFVAMYFLMYAMVNALGNVVMNFNQVYMAGLMAAPMVLIELVLMGKMYPDKKRNAIIGVAAIAVGVVFFVAIRQQAAIGNRQFLRSMIPHHASAILMCEKASITSAAIKELCFRPQGIVASQSSEIEQMKTLLSK